MNTAPGEEEEDARVVGDLVPVTLPVKDVFPHKQKCLKPLVASLEVWWCSNEIFGMPKGGIRHRRSVAVRDRPPSGSWRGALFTDIRDCPLKSIGVPVKFPVKNRLAVHTCTKRQVSLRQLDSIAVVT